MTINDCRNCFYGELFSDTCESCIFGIDGGGQNNWVSIDFLKDVKDDSVTDKVGVKFDQDKPQWSLLPFPATTEVVKVLTVGAKKYAPDNWKIVPNARQRYIDAAFRHMSAYAGGEKDDAETGLNHTAHAICCLLFLLSFDIEGK